MAEKVYATGRRKTSIARVFLTPGGSGKITINKREFTDYFPEYFQAAVLRPLKETDLLGKVDIYATVKGGGLTGQSQALRHGIARAVDKSNTETYHKILKLAGLLTRDPRMVERKKFGLRKARKREQYSKR